MRIISGKYRGKRITAPKNVKARPTTDFAKESLFNILTHRLDFDGLEVLDLFSGTGNISYEFASRGAQQVYAVDITANSFLFVRRTSTELELPIISIKEDAFKYLGRASVPFDIIFADPPYDHPRYNDIPRMVFEKNLLSEDGLLIVEHDDRTKLADHPNFTEVRKYGKVHFSFFQAQSSLS